MPHTYTIQARELREAWIRRRRRFKAVAAEPAERQPEIVVEVGAEPFDSYRVSYRTYGRIT